MTRLLMSCLLVFSLSGLMGLTNFSNSAPVINDTIDYNLSAAQTGRTQAVQIELNASGQMLLSWDAIPGATAYNIYYANVPEPTDSETWALLISLPSENLSYLSDFVLSKAFFYVTGLVPVQGSLILVEGGAFNNGTSNVTVSSFYLDKHELTQAEYLAIMGTNPSDTSYGIGNDYPVNRVSWFNAIEYCNRRSISEGLAPCYSYLTYGTNPDNWPAGWGSSNSGHTNVSCNWTVNGYRLPTEAEWEYAARGGNQTNNYTYSGSDVIGTVAWYALNNIPFSTKQVGTKASNELGLFDLSGNVWEWNWDIYGSYSIENQTNPTGAASGSYRVYRGGGFSSDAIDCTVSHRIYGGACNSGGNMGFRVSRAGL